MSDSEEDGVTLDSLKIGDVVEVPVVDVADNGEGVGKFDSGLVVLIDGAFEGKIVEAKITKIIDRQREDSGYAKGELKSFVGDIEEEDDEDEEKEEEQKYNRSNWYGDKS